MSDVVLPCGDRQHNPFFKRLLRIYQESAERSLEGPTLCSMADGDDMVKVEVVHSDGETLIERGQAVGSRVDAMPSLVPLSRVQGDPHLRLETTLEGESISCFVVGGERRLCVPQMLNTVLTRFTLSEIHSACDCLRIHIALADDRQLTVLRRDGILPQTAHGCGLVTLTDAQRLCCVLLGHRGTRPSSPTTTAEEPSESIMVMHRCFGKCIGSLRPSTRLVRCAACRHEFDVQQFVCHSHGDQEARTCHWGFDAANWRVYLQLAPDVAKDEILQNYLDYFKDHADVSSSNSRKRRDIERTSDVRYAADKRRRCHDGHNVETDVLSSAGHVPDSNDEQRRPPRPADSLEHQSSTSSSRQDLRCSWPGETSTTTTTTTTGAQQRYTAAAAKARVLSADITTSLRVAASSAVVLPQLSDGGCGLSSSGSLVDLFEAEYQLFKSAIYGSMSGLTTNGEHLVDEFVCLQQRHAALVARLLRSHAHLQQEVTMLHETLSAKLLAAAAETETRQRQIEAMRRDDEAKLREAKRENEALRDELEAMISGAKRTEIGLVKAKYKARAKHFQCKVQTVEQSNVQLVSELAAARDALRHYHASSSSLSSSSSSPASGVAAAGPLPAGSPSSLVAAVSAVPTDTVTA